MGVRVRVENEVGVVVDVKRRMGEGMINRRVGETVSLGEGSERRSGRVSARDHV